ncbi:Aminopeptidase C [Streptococcus acidominimus]|uniref:Aminopeptidase C n=1 Tax=Streptococcus acidominimus TaxID=1326 RepID=A0A239WMQ1_STRAI|nr:Aminopeptidase C [Streptococcus acidominimus]
MSELTQNFTDRLFDNYQANLKFQAVENAVTHNGLLKSLETRQSAVENDYVFSVDLTKDAVSN